MEAQTTTTEQKNTSVNNQIARAADKPNQPTRVWKTWNMPQKAGGFQIVGFSRAADRTFFHIPDMKLSLDAGHCRGRQPDNVFITHTHMDHVKDIAYMCKKENVIVHCPASATEALKNYIRSEYEMDWNCAVDLSTMSFTLTPHVIDGEETFEMCKGKYVVRSFPCFHKVPCLGYAFSEKRRRLKKEYAGVPGKELGKLRKEGTQIDEEYTIPLFAYVGDTSTIIYQKTPWLFDYPLIITECTFLYNDNERDDLREKAEKDGHTHWDLLQPVILAHPEVTFMLIHFSLRYSEQEIYDFFNGLINRETDPLNLNNVVLFLGDHSEGRKDK